MQWGSIHEKEVVSGYVFTCRPDDPGRDGTIRVEHYITVDGGDRAKEVLFHSFHTGFRVTNLFDYQSELKWELEEVHAHLDPIIRRHFQSQLLSSTKEAHRYVVGTPTWRK